MGNEAEGQWEGDKIGGGICFRKDTAIRAWDMYLFARL